MLETVILAGGLGSRLRCSVPDLPKPMAPIKGQPFLTLLFEQLLDAGIQKVILAVGYKKQKIINEFGKNYKGLAIDYAVEESLLGTGGAILNALKGRNYQEALVLNGDSFCNAPLRDFINSYKSLAREASLILSYQKDQSRYGGVEYDEKTFQVFSFIEKQDIPMSGYINAGIYLFSKSFINQFPTTTPLSLENEILPFRLNLLYAWPTEGEFIDIGTVESYKQAPDYLQRFLSNSR